MPPRASRIASHANAAVRIDAERREIESGVEAAQSIERRCVVEECTKHRQCAWRYDVAIGRARQLLLEGAIRFPSPGALDRTVSALSARTSALPEFMKEITGARPVLS
jgi:hypothetical protein